MFWDLSLSSQVQVALIKKTQKKPDKQINKLFRDTEMNEYKCVFKFWSVSAELYSVSCVKWKEYKRDSL